MNVKLLLQLLQSFHAVLPRIGSAGSRSARLHDPQREQDPDQRAHPRSSTTTETTAAHYPELPPATLNSPLVNAATGADLEFPHSETTAPSPRTVRVTTSRPARFHTGLSVSEIRRFAFLRWAGTLGACLLSIGGLGAGALPVVENPYAQLPFGSIMARMLQTSMVLCFLGVGLLVIAWLGLAPFSGAFFRQRHNTSGIISLSLMRRTFIAWAFPLLFSAPMFTQDIYSYLANGSIIRLGLDPYSAGPIDLLGADNPLARSVPFIWAHSPSPYGPVALGLATVISWITQDSIPYGVAAHRFFSIIGLALAGWAIVHLARRCKVAPQAALWLALLNPLTLLHLVAGLHNESLLLGLVLAGMELSLRACDGLRTKPSFSLASWTLFIAGCFLISCGGMVKVTGFIGLGFAGMALARVLLPRRGHWRALGAAVVLSTGILVASIAFMTVLSGIPTGWITGQGGAVSIRSWLSFSTSIGVLSGKMGMLLDLGDHTESILVFTRLVGLLVAAAFIVRMLLATYRGAIAPIGALGVSTFVLVVCFPVVHPWYLLWAIFPLAPWANRALFRVMILIYSVVISFTVLPRGMGLPPGTVFSIYAGFILSFIVLVLIFWWILKQRRIIGDHADSTDGTASVKGLV